MDFKVRFSENRQDFVANFEQTTIVSEGGYEEGYQKGKLEGLEEGYSKGYTEGQSDGYEKGYTKGQEKGYFDGYSTGHTNGYGEGHASGYEEGYDNGKAERTYEIWTITLTDGTVIEKEVALL